jgi:glycosyltransferase involved in cell wall biosynthesis
MSVRVLHCLWHGEVGGAERAVEQLVRAQLRQPSVEPSLLFGQRGGLYWERAQDLGCPVITLDLPHGHAVSDIPAAASAMRPFDIHHFHSPEVSLMVSSAMCRGVRRVYTHRGGLTRYPAKTRARNALAGIFLRHAFHAYSGNTRHAADSAIRLFHLSPERVAVTYNGLHFDLLQPHRNADDLRRELRLDDDSFVVGTAANLKPWKRVDRLLTAVERLADPRVHGLVIGDGIDRRRLERIVVERGLEAQVTFAGMHENVADYLQVMDSFVLPSTGLESFGNALVEAMASGLPSIAFDDGGGMLEHIDDGRTGYIVASQEELELRLRELLEQPQLRGRMGGEAKAHVRGRYTPERSAQAYAELYDDALNA